MFETFIEYIYNSNKNSESFCSSSGSRHFHFSLVMSINWSCSWKHFSWQRVLRTEIFARSSTLLFMQLSSLECYVQICFRSQKSCEFLHTSRNQVTVWHKKNLKKGILLLKNISLPKESWFFVQFFFSRLCDKYKWMD